MKPSKNTREWMKRFLIMLLSVALMVTTMPLYGSGRAYAQREADASAGYQVFSQQVKADGMTVTVRAPEGLFPADAALDVSKITDQTILAKAGKAIEEVSEDGVEPDAPRVFDINILDSEGNELQPEDGSEGVAISFSKEDGQVTEAVLYQITEAEESAEENEGPLDKPKAEPDYKAERFDASWNAATNMIEVETTNLSLFAAVLLSESSQDPDGIKAADEENSEPIDNAESEDPAAPLKSDQDATATKAQRNLKSLSAEGQEISSWQGLQDAVNASADGTETTLVLSGDITATSKEDRIQIKKNKVIVLDLAGHKLDRNRTSNDGDGHVIEVFGKLIVEDSSSSQSGQITGGYATRGGGINVNETGECDFRGGNITKNKAGTDGGGVYVNGTSNKYLPEAAARLPVMERLHLTDVDLSTIT